MKKVVIIDVREEKEFRDGSIPGAVNLPSSKFDIELFSPYRENVICLVCQSGERAKNIKKRLSENNISDVHLLGRHMESLNEKKETKGWSVDRQFRMILGLLLATFLGGFFAGIEGFVVIPMILATGLIVTSIIDRCYMRMGIALLPWNRGKKSGA